eukprot:m.11795 g.11795  ORF g.11795 m.11795 type:complete len:94 (+) comp5769_c0_seq1:2943-3224(+)
MAKPHSTFSTLLLVLSVVPHQPPQAPSRLSKSCIANVCGAIACVLGEVICLHIVSFLVYLCLHSVVEKLPVIEPMSLVFVLCSSQFSKSFHLT